MSDCLDAARAILCPECHGKGLRSWPADTDTCRGCSGGGVQPGTCPGAAIRAMGAELFGARAEVERLRASRARWSVAAGIAADTLCPQCGVGVDTDEDGCCWTCGATATGDAVESRRVSIEAAEAADVAAGVSDV